MKLQHFSLKLSSLIISYHTVVYGPGAIFTFPLHNDIYGYYGTTRKYKIEPSNHFDAISESLCHKKEASRDKNFEENKAMLFMKF